MLFICYSKCSTCNKAKKWLNDNGVGYENRDIKENNPTKSELKTWYEQSGLPLKKFFNTSGLVYRELNLKDKLPNMTKQQQLDLLSTNGMLVKRPIIIDGQNILVGFKETQFKEHFGK